MLLHVVQGYCVHYHRCGVDVCCAFFFLLSNVPSHVFSICVLYVFPMLPMCDSDPSLYREGGRKFLAIYKIEDNYSNKGRWRWGTIVWLGVHRPDQRSYEREGRERSVG